MSDAIGTRWEVGGHEHCHHARRSVCSSGMRVCPNGGTTAHQLLFDYDREVAEH